MVVVRFMLTVAGTAELAPQRTHRLSEPLFNITLSRFQSLRVLMLLLSCEPQLSLTQAETFAGGADQSHAPEPPPPPPPNVAPPAPAPAAPPPPASEPPACPTLEPAAPGVPAPPPATAPPLPPSA